VPRSCARRPPSPRAHPRPPTRPSASLLALLRGRQHIVLVDEVDDTRETLSHVVPDIIRQAQPSAVSVAVVHSKKKSKCDIPVDVAHFVVGEHTEDIWLCYPWDAADVRQHEVEAARCAREKLAMACASDVAKASAMEDCVFSAAAVQPEESP